MMDNRLPREKKIGSSRSGALQKDAENKIERWGFATGYQRDQIAFMGDGTLSW